MNNVRTVSDTKRTFHSLHTRPIHTIYRRVVEELMVEMHLLQVSVDFRYNPIYGLGVVTSFERFMQGYQPELDKESIFNALLQAVESDPQIYRQDAQRLQNLARSLSPQDLIAVLSLQTQLQQDPDFQNSLQAIANDPHFKYSRLFAIGLFLLLELSDPDIVKDEKKRTEALKTIAAGLHLSEDKLTKDLELYLANLEKMKQALTVMADMLSSERKKRQQRAQQSTTTTTPPAANEQSQA